MVSMAGLAGALDDDHCLLPLLLFGPIISLCHPFFTLSSVIFFFFFFPLLNIPSFGVRWDGRLQDGFAGLRRS